MEWSPQITNPRIPPRSGGYEVTVKPTPYLSIKRKPHLPETGTPPRQQEGDNPLDKERMAGVGAKQVSESCSPSRREKDPPRSLCKQTDMIPRPRNDRPLTRDEPGVIQVREGRDACAGYLYTSDLLYLIHFRIQSTFIKLGNVSSSAAPEFRPANAPSGRERDRTGKLRRPPANTGSRDRQRPCSTCIWQHCRWA